MTTATDSFDMQPPRHSRWEPMRATTLEDARRRTDFVRMLRFALIGLAAALGLIVVIQLLLNNSNAEPEAVETVGENARMINPRFTGRDEGGAPFTVTADTAIRRRGEALNLTELENPRIDFEMLEAIDQSADGVLAETGIYDSEARTLDLDADVRFRTRSGYLFRSEDARIYLGEDRVVGDSAVEGIGPMGRIRADRYEVLDGGDHVVFTGNVVARIETDNASATTAPGTEDE
ncbi:MULTISPECIES: LPS export ABC transporter periplasmic protein LptC [Hyphobacterium]|uniref:LPS export ABC transporter periplasmic protein LptC n=1 Tax=Hyphobacterium vulgare TaxID=1736751 RepID=A0ABV6ZXS8_9PROT